MPMNIKMFPCFRLRPSTAKSAQSSLRNAKGRTTCWNSGTPGCTNNKSQQLWHPPQLNAPSRGSLWGHWEPLQQLSVVLASVGSYCLYSSLSAAGLNRQPVPGAATRAGQYHFISAGNRFREVLVKYNIKIKVILHTCYDFLLLWPILVGPSHVWIIWHYILCKKAVWRVQI